MNYYDNPRMSRSKLCDLKISPYYYWSKHINKGFEEDSACMKLGRAFHCKVLEPHNFNRLYAIAPELNKRTLEGKKQYEGFEADNKNKEILSHSEGVLIHQLLNALDSNQQVKRLLDNCKHKEKELYFDYQDIDFKAKLDAIAKGQIIIDLKTISCSMSAERMKQTLYKYNYAEQVFLYSYAMEQLFNVKPMFYIISIAKKPPYEVCMYDVSSFYSYGEESVHHLVSQYKQCVKRWGEDPSFPWMDHNIIKLGEG